MPSIVRVIIPAFNEEGSITKVIDAIPSELVTEVIVANNNSTDRTALRAKEAGATVVDQPNPGYGNACLKGLQYIKENSLETDIVVFMDGDYSDYPEEMSMLIDPILNEKMEMVIGSRALGQRERGSMTVPQQFGNWLATWLIQIIYRFRYTDLGPFRAIRYDALVALDMQDQNYGWTVEMQLKAVKKKLRIKEVPVNYRQRIGVSKISGTVKGVFMAGYKIIWTIFKHL